MPYTHFAYPGPFTTAVEWSDWMRGQNIVHDFLPAPSDVCDFCGRPCNSRPDGTKWPLCYTCPSATQYLDGLVVGSYSLQAGLESLAGTFKDDPAAPGEPPLWKRIPLGLILAKILVGHEVCIRAVLGDDAVFTWVPSNNPARSFDHIEQIIRGVRAQWESYPWRPGIVTRTPGTTRPNRQSVVPASYTVNTDVEGQSILLLDDLWTSGASMVSTAAALKLAGASRVVGVVLGRQVNPSLNASGPLAAEIETRGWSLGQCSLCA